MVFFMNQTPQPPLVSWIERPLGTAMAWILLITLCACSESSVKGTYVGLGEPDGSDSAPSGTWLIETELSAHEVKFGETVTVTCTVTDSQGGHIDAHTSVWVTPDVGIGVNDHVLKTSKAGKFLVACRLTSLDLLDATMEELTVLPGEPHSVRAIVDPTEIVAGSTADVECRVTDYAGNAIDIPTAVEAQPGLDVVDHTVTGVKTGEYKVSCQVPGYRDIASIPGPLKVIAGAPAKVVLFIDPEEEVYEPGAVVHPTWKVYDAAGNELKKVAATLTPPDHDAVAKAGGKFLLPVDGLYTFTVTLDPPSAPYNDSKTLLVDSKGPELIVEWPPRGETIQGSGEDPVIIVGHCTDPSGVEWLKINGTLVTLEADGSFETPMKPSWGLNWIVAEAKDKQGYDTRITPTYYYSTAYQSWDNTNSAADVRLDDAILGGMAQDFLDDGVHDPAHPNDLATLLELVLGLLDLNTLIPGFSLPPFDTTLPDALNFEIPGPFGLTFVVQGDIQLAIEVGNLVFGKPAISIDARHGGIDTSIGLGNAQNPAIVLPITLTVTAPVTLTVIAENPFNGQPISFDFELEGVSILESGFQIEHIGILTSLDVSKSPGNDAQIAVADIVFEVDGVGLVPLKSAVIDFGQIQLPIIGNIPIQFDVLAIFPQINDLMDLLVLDPLWDLVEPTLSGFVEPLVDSLVATVADLVFSLLNLETTLPLPNLLAGADAPPVNLGVSLGLDSIHFDDPGGVFGLGLGFWTEKGTDRTPLGLPLRDGCLSNNVTETASLPLTKPLEVAGLTDMLNQLLFSLWWSGALDGSVDLSGLGGLLGGGGGLPGGIDLDGLVLEPTFLLPPILNDCNTTGWSTLQLGDLYVDLDVAALGFPITAQMFVDISLQIDVQGGPDGLTIVVGEFEILDLEVLSTAGGLGSLFDVGSILESFLIPAIQDGIAGLTLGPIPLPGIPLDGLLPGIPPGTTFQLGDFTVQKGFGYATIGIAIQ